MNTTTQTGIVGSYLTAAGIALADRSITVDLTDNGCKAICRGCGDDWGNSYAFTVRQWAESHAENCRAIPQPAN